MNSCKKCCGNEFQLKMFSLEHTSPAQFYISCWQKGQSRIPLLLGRGVLFLFSLGIVISSMTWLGTAGYLSYWFIYMTHWGVVMIMLTTGFSFAISLHSYFNNDLEFAFGLPWYIKVYWILFNISTPIAFMITVFYYAFLVNALVDYAPNFALDILVHGMNSVVMFLELISSGHPSRLLHFYHPICFGVVYALFGLIYYLAGGLDIFGNNFIYPMVDWSEPGMTVVVVILTAILILFMHVIVVGLTTARDILANKYTKKVENENKSVIPDI